MPIENQELNGTTGTIVRFDIDSGRWAVRLATSADTILLKADNLLMVRGETEGVTP